MENKFYQMPLRFDQLIEQNGELQPANLGVSIAQNIFLIVSSQYNEHRFDPEFGCEIWERDFELITNPLAWQEQVNRSILRSVIKYERRLERVDIDTSLTEEPHFNPVTKVHSIKKRLTINVTGTVKATGESYSYSPQLFLSPVSVD